MDRSPATARPAIARDRLYDPACGIGHDSCAGAAYSPADRGETLSGGTPMLWTLVVILFVLWILGFGVFHITSALIHLLLIAAVIILLVRLFTGRRPVA